MISCYPFFHAKFTLTLPEDITCTIYTIFEKFYDLNTLKYFNIHICSNWCYITIIKLRNTVL